MNNPIRGDEMKIDKGQGVAIAAIVAIVVIVGILAGVSATRNERIVYVEKVGNPVTATLIIDFENGTVWNYSVTTTNATVYGLLMDASHAYNFTVKSHYDSGAGMFVDSIAGAENGEGNRYWMYSVNNNSPWENPSADKKTLSNNDVVSWTYTVFG
jgi:hypothetical protein